MPNLSFYTAEMDGLDWQRVRSTNVARYAYAEDFRRLYVEFKAKGEQPARMYVYHKVEPGMVQGLASAPSKGRFVYYVLRAGGTDSVYAYDQLW